ncbi:HAD family hydrolase [Granulicella tundricola]|uniref:HAD-superfamily hydrolase, subfamily IA, variant 3 n=1 Tax=Granulicella tundricola (strain ATCC BAA-1859 / DSM 23138 / MP5ACTX9) TaxID=1198114 RepID=E8WXH5_GRATM|nr:HAD family phosphatase [Granulicella tundricola]ADW67508.1 HAD-superfamily hydrolase, subfamily IA, variant 3 [Granulicella tundricola MP5ACTX9]
MNGSIRTLFWDIGGVILTNGWDRNQRKRVLSRLGVDMEAYEEAHERANYYWERGLITAKEFFAQTVLTPNPELDLTFEIVWPQVCAESKVLHPECLDMLAELKGQGRYRIATLNNESRELNGYRLDAFKMRSLFDYFICSGSVHEMKPMPGIYRSAVDISGFEARTALFIDDKEENCEAARAVGMNAIRFESPQQLCLALADYDVHVSSLEMV